MSTAFSHSRLGPETGLCDAPAKPRRALLLACRLHLGHVWLFLFIFSGCRAYSRRPGLIYRGLAGASLPAWMRHSRALWDLTAARSVSFCAYGNRRRYVNIVNLRLTNQKPLHLLHRAGGGNVCWLPVHGGVACIWVAEMDPQQDHPGDVLVVLLVGDAPNRSVAAGKEEPEQVVSPRVLQSRGRWQDRWVLEQVLLPPDPGKFKAEVLAPPFLEDSCKESCDFV